ncbi:MAG: metal ABC transporter ATP-binding protein [Clostridiales bacterium]|nr:metal ABC transporter ATP-binding protein [Clostridiales bacterium]
MSLITCEKATFAYEGVPVVRDLDLQIEKGQYLCIVGENGSGKSTLVKGLLGLLKPVSGKVTFGDGLRQTEIGYLPQRVEWQPDFPASVWEVASSGCHGLWMNSQRRQQVEENLHLMGMEHLAKRSFARLSGGQQQRVLLARALCATRSLLLLDEPVAGLDPVVTREMYDVIRMLHEQRDLTVVMISHDIQAATQEADRILHLSNTGSFYGTPFEYRHSPLGVAFFGGCCCHE